MMLRNLWLAVKRRTAFAAVFATACVAGCSSDEMATAMVAPGKYDLFSCSELTIRGGENVKRERELKELMERSERGTGGALINVLAYRTEYFTVRGELARMAAAAAEKKCTSFNSVIEGTVK